MLVELDQPIGGRVAGDVRIVDAMNLDVAAHQQRNQFQVEFHQAVREPAASGFSHRLDPLAHPLEVGPVLDPAIQVEERLDLLGQREAQQVTGVGRADFLEGVEERFRRERLNQALGLGGGENQVAFLPRRQAVEELQLFLEGQT